MIVHCAASVSFGLSLEQARAINVEGTRRMLELAGRAQYLELTTHPAFEQHFIAAMGF